MVERHPHTIVSLVVSRGEHAEAFAQDLKERAQQLGGVSVSQVTGLNAQWYHLSGDELARQRRLDTSVVDLIQTDSIPSKPSAALATALWESGVRTARDVLVIGRHGLDRWRIGQKRKAMTSEQVNQLEAALAQELPEEQLLPKPTPVDAAKLCFNLGQVTALTLGPYRRAASTLSPFSTDLAQSVSAFVDGSNSWLVEQFTPCLDGTPDEYGRYDACVAAAHRFAAEFLQARADLERENL